jgi:hypothetical protein
MTEPESLAAVLMQVAGHAERIGVVDAREQAHAREVSARLADLCAALAELRGAVSDQAGVLAGLDQRVAQVASRLDAIGADGTEGDTAGHMPSPAVRWHEATAQQRDAALARLAGWVEEIYRHGYGHVSAGLGACWQSHPLCLFTLDWLSELWTVLYHQPIRTPRTLAGQAEFTTRILPAAAELMAAETRRCDHAARAPRPGAQRTWPGGRT